MVEAGSCRSCMILQTYGTPCDWIRSLLYLAQHCELSQAAALKSLSGYPLSHLLSTWEPFIKDARNSVWDLWYAKAGDVLPLPNRLTFLGLPAILFSPFASHRLPNWRMFYLKAGIRFETFNLPINFKTDPTILRKSVNTAIHICFQIQNQG